jgi:glycosyltransferase involved in cell wall biosynthesis
MYTKLPKTSGTETIDGINCHRINVPLGRKFFPVASILPAWKLANKMDILQFDTFYAGMSGWIPGKLSRKPYLLAVYEFFQEIWNTMTKNKMEAWFYKNAEKYLANSPYPQFLTISEYTKRRMINLGCEKKLIKVVYLGVDHSIFHPEYKNNLRKKYKLNKKFILGWTGRMNLSQSKNLPTLLKSFKIVKESIPNVVLVFDGPDFHNLKPVIEEMGLKIGKDIIYNGCVPRKELAAVYSSMDLYVCSSLSEGFGLSVVEAEACGTPVVCFETGSLPEVVNNKKTGTIVKEKNEESMANAIIDLLTNDEKRKKYGNEASKWAKKFNWNYTGNETIKLYEKMIENSK